MKNILLTFLFLNSIFCLAQNEQLILTEKANNLWFQKLNTTNELNEKIEYLQLTPARRKRIDEEKNKQAETVEISSALPLEDLTKDGGSF